MRNLYAVVDESGSVVAETGAPFDAETLEEATREVESTFGRRDGWCVVLMTAEHEEAYDAL